MEYYNVLVRKVLQSGNRKPNRTGVDTLSIFGHYYELSARDNGFPILSTKEVSWKNIVVELLWFLTGTKDTAFLKKHKCKFWDPWTDEKGEVSSGYGTYWRSFPSRTGANDQIQFVIDELKRNINSRRLVVSAWNPEDAQTNHLPPCHLLFVFNVQYNRYGEPSLNLHLTQRSCDIALGLPYNTASYALLLELMSRFTGIQPGTFAHSIVDAHIYIAKEDDTQAEYDHRPGLIEQLDRRYTTTCRTTLEINENIKTLDDVMALTELDTKELMSNFVLHNYNPQPAIKFKVAV